MFLFCTNLKINFETTTVLKSDGKNQLFCKISVGISVGFLQMCWWALAKKVLEKRINFGVGVLFFIFCCFLFRFMYIVCKSIAYNGSRLCEVADFKALTFNLALKFNWKTAVECCTSARLTQNPCWTKPSVALPLV